MDDVLCFHGMIVAARFQLGLHDPNGHHYYSMQGTLACSHWLSRVSRVLNIKKKNIYDLSSATFRLDR